MREEDKKILNMERKGKREIMRGQERGRINKKEEKRGREGEEGKEILDTERGEKRKEEERGR